MDAAPVGDEAKNVIRDKVKELATLSKELEQLTRQMGFAQSTIQVGFLKGRVDELTAVQTRLVREIAQTCPDPELKSTFEGLDRRLDSMRAQVQESKQADELQRLKDEIDPLVDEWAQVFQQLVLVALGGPRAEGGGAVLGASS